MSSLPAYVVGIQGNVELIMHMHAAPWSMQHTVYNIQHGYCGFGGMQAAPLYVHSPALAVLALGSKGQRVHAAERYCSAQRTELLCSRQTRATPVR